MWSRSEVAANYICCTSDLASYPSLLTPAFIACSINTGEGLVKQNQSCALTYMNVGWTCGGVTHSRKNCKEVSVLRSQTRTVEQLSARHQIVLATFLEFRKPLYRECATPPHIQPMSRYITACDQFYQAFPQVGTASNKRWGEKAWIQGYLWPPMKELCWPWWHSGWYYGLSLLTSHMS